MPWASETQLLTSAVSESIGAASRMHVWQSAAPPASGRRGQPTSVILHRLVVVRQPRWGGEPPGPVPQACGKLAAAWRCSSVRCTGKRTSTSAIRSPLASPRSRGIPRPRKRSWAPFWVSAGTVRATRLPPGVGTSTLPPRRATPRGTETRTRRLSPSRVKVWWGRSRTRTSRSPAAPPSAPGLPWPEARTLAPSLIPAGMRTSTRRLPDGPVSSRVRVVPRNASSKLISASPSTFPPRRGVGGAGWRTRPVPAPVAPRQAAEPLRLGAQLVIGLALLGVAEHLVGLGELLEPGLGILAALVDVGVVLPGQLAEGSLDLLLRRRAGDAEGRVVIPEGRRHIVKSGPSPLLGSDLWVPRRLWRETQPPSDHEM